MSGVPTDCRVPDPTDAKADGNFGNHRAGYSSDKLANAEYWARKGGTLNAGEGAILCAEIDRLRTGVDLLKGQYDDAWKVGMEAVEKMRRLEEEIDRLRAILAALQPVGDVLLRYYNMEASEDDVYAVFCAWRTATSPVTAAKKEVQGE